MRATAARAGTARADRRGINMTIQVLPQIIAFVLAHLKPRKASLILQNLPLEILGLITTDRLSPEIIYEIERILEKKLLMRDSEDSIDYIAVEGAESIIETLNHADSDSKNRILRELAKDDPELAVAIRRSKRK